MQTHPLPPIQTASVNAPGQAKKTTAESEAGGTNEAGASEPAVEIQLSETAESILAGPHGADRPGNSGNAPAHLVRSMIAENSFAESAKNFGQMVSAFVRGINEAAETGGDTVDAVATGEEVEDTIAPLPPETDVIDELSGGDDAGEAPAEEPIADAAPAAVEPLADAEDELLELLSDGETETV